MAAFSELLKKLASGEKLSSIEQDNLFLQARKLEQAEALLTFMIKPGTNTLKIDNLHANDILIANRDVEIDEFGVFFKNQEGEIGYETTDGDPEGVTVSVDATDTLILKNKTGVAGVEMQIDDSSHNVMYADFHEDNVAGELEMYLSGATNGVRINLMDAVYLYSKALGLDYSFLQLPPSPNPDTTFLAASSGAQFYVKGGKFIVRYSDAGTIRYKYIDLTGTGATWTHTTTPP